MLYIYGPWSLLFSGPVNIVYGSFIDNVPGDDPGAVGCLYTVHSLLDQRLPSLSL